MGLKDGENEEDVHGKEEIISPPTSGLKRRRRRDLRRRKVSNRYLGDLKQLKPILADA